MLVKDFSLLCNYKTEFPVLKAYFMKHGIPFEPCQVNNTMSLVVYTCTELDHRNVLDFTMEAFGW